MIDRIIKELQKKQFEEPYSAGINYALGIIEALTPSKNEKKLQVTPNQKLFDEFWKLYPNKKAKPYALKVWNRLKVNEELFKKIIYALEAHKKSLQWTKNRGQFIPHPSTWLNQSRWEDTLLEPEKKAYYKGNPMIWNELKKKWFVIIDGEFLEFNGSKNEIEYK